MKEQLADKSKRDTDELMEHIRKNPPRVKSISEVVNLLHVISAEQRSCNVLRSCVDKVLMNMSNIRTLRDIIERLRSVSRTNGFRFELPTSASPETRCQLVSDMFSVKIVLGTSSTPDHSPTVVDVSIKHKEDYRSCPHLANVIRAGKFLELSDHLKGLMEMYSSSGSRQSRTRIYLALQSLETDLVKMSHMYSETHKDATVLDIAMNGTLGFLTPRLAGDRPHFAYYVSPYDLIDTVSKCKITLKDNVPRNLGLHAEVSIEQRNTSCTLPISPLITNKHPVDKSGMPRLMDISHHNSTSVQACFVLHMKPPVPILTKVAEDISKITGLDLCSDSGEKKKYLELLCAKKNTYKVVMGEESHVYHLDLSNLKGTLVNKIYFTHPGHVVRILELLRKQAHLNTLISSCIRDFNNVPKIGKEWYFEVSCSKDIGKVNITMEHPSARGTASMEIRLDKNGFSKCKIFTGRGDPPLCSDEYVVKILRNCSSLPITMRKLIEQSIKNPRKESDVNRTRPPALFAPPAASRQPLPNILTPVPRPSLPHQLPSQQSNSALAFGGAGASTFPFTPTSEASKSSIMPKKCADNPMLTQLLIPKAGASSDMMEAADQPIRSHPMLLTLLKDDSDQDPQVPQSRSSKLTSNVPMTSSQSMGLNGGNQQTQFNSPANPQMGFMSPNSTYPNLEPPIPVPTSYPMPPPSYPSHSQNQFNPPTQLPTMSPQVPNSPYSSQPSPMGGMDEITGPVTPTHPFGMMSPGLISPSISQAMTKGRRPSRQKSHSTENSDFSSFDMPQCESQMSVESTPSLFSEMLGMPNRTGMTQLRRTESMSPGGTVASQHMPLQHTSSLKSISGSGMSASLLTRSISVSSGKSPRSMTSPGPRNLRTPETMMALSSPPMFDAPAMNQRGARVKSYDSHTSDHFRSPLPSASPGGMASLNLLPMGPGSQQDADPDPFTFDDNKIPSNISVSENTFAPFIRGGKPPPPFPSTSIENSEALRELAKTKPVLLRALTGDAPTVKTEVPSALQRQLGTATSGLMVNLGTTTTTQAASSVGSFDYANKLMTSTTITTISDKSLVRQNALDKSGTSTAQNKASDLKSEKAVKRRNSNKNEEGKPVAKKRGRPPTVNHHGGKRKKGDAGGNNDESGSNPPIMLNIQLSSTGAPISSTTKVKPLVGSASAPSHKNPSGGVSSAAGTSNNASNPSGGSVGSIATDPNFGSLSHYLKSQKELQQKMKVKEKKGVGKASSKHSFSNQSSTGGTTSTEKSQPGTQAGKSGPSPRAGGGLPAPRKRKASIKDIVDKLQSKASETSATPRSSSPDKLNAEKDVGKKSFLIGGLSKTGAATKITGGDDKLGKGTLAPKLTKIATPKMSLNVVTASKQSGVLMPVGSVKGGRLSTEAMQGRKSGDGIDQVLKSIMEAADASTKRNTHSTPLNKPPPVKAARPGPPVKARSTTPTSVTSVVSQTQRKSPSSQMLKTLSDVSGRTMPLKMASNTGSVSPQFMKKSPLRNSGLSARPSSSSSAEAPAGKQSSTSSAAPVIGISRKSQHLSSSTPGDQRFVAPSISQTPKRTSSPQIPRTTSPLTRVEDMHGKGLPGRSPHRPSPTHSRMSTPVPASSPQSPDDRLMIVDDPAPNSAVQPLSRDEQKPVFIPGKRVSDRLSPERTAMPSPLSPPPLAQKSSTSLLQAATKRAPTPRSNIASPGMSPANSSSPFFVDDDLMNQAVTG